MRTFPLMVLAALAVTSLPTPIADAYYCVTDGTHAAGPRCCDSKAHYALGSDTGPRFYLDVRSTRDGTVWVYQESNGIEGLQRGGFAVAGVNQQLHLNPIHTSQGSTPGYEDELSSRWDGCFDELPGLPRDTNLI